MNLPALEYAPRPAGRQRMRATRVLSLCALFASSLAVIGVGGPRLWRHAELLYWQRQAMRFTAPAGLVVYDARGSIGSARIPRAYSEVWTPSADVLSAKPWEGFYNELRLNAARSATVFLHECRNSRGEARLVAVYVFPATSQPLLIGVVCRPGSIVREAREASTTLRVVTATPQDRLRIYAGQPDPAEPAHFTARYQINGQEHVLHGWLRDDDQVELTFR